MNERIRELALEAFQPINDIASEGVADRYTFDQAWFQLYNEKFAELIVRECARIARATPCPYEEEEVRQRLGHTWDMASLEAGYEIVKHFGVKE